MKTSKFLRDYLSNELTIISEKMDEADNPFDKLYYFSAVYGAIQRVLSIEYDPSLALTHLVCITTHNAFVGRLQAIKEGKETSIKLNVEIFTTLSALTSELATTISNDTDVTDILERMSVITHSLSGAGYFLAQTGRLG